MPSLKNISVVQRVSSLGCFVVSLAALMNIGGCGGGSAPDGAASGALGVPSVVSAAAHSSLQGDRDRTRQASSKSVLSNIGPSLFSFRGTHGTSGLGNGQLPNGSSGQPGQPMSALDQMLAAAGDSKLEHGPCPPDMASVEGRFCVDKFEASLVEMLPDGSEKMWSPFVGMEGHEVRAVSQRGVFPQGYISEKQAKSACQASGKRLCKAAEWKMACMGPEKTTYPYGNDDEPRRCNDHGNSPIAARLKEGRETNDPIQWSWSWDRMNDTALNQYEGTLAKSGDHDGCTNGYGVYDMVGNLHEWVDDRAGTFLGGYYQDTHQNGDGCGYKTMAHEAWYHDYSTGFRCCAETQDEE